LHPEIFKDILSSIQPELNDQSLIQKFYDHYSKIHDLNKDYRQRLIFISSILNLFSPSSLVYGERVTPGVLTTLQQCFGKNNKQSIGIYVYQTPAYFKNQAFKEEVENVSKLFREVI